MAQKATWGPDNPDFLLVYAIYALKEAVKEQNVALLALGATHDNYFTAQGVMKQVHRCQELLQTVQDKIEEKVGHQDHGSESPILPTDDSKGGRPPFE